MHQYNPSAFTFEDHIRYARRIAANDGPHKSEFHSYRSWYDALNSHLQSGAITTEQRKRIRDEFGEAYSVRTLQGHVYQQPLGYAGDYLLIEKIYENQIAEDPRFRRYDEFFQAQHAAVAVRNRKLYFKELIRRTVAFHQEPIRVLNLASGPCQDIKELLDESPTLPVSFVCVDVDQNALNYAQTKLADHSDRIEFFLQNVIRWREIRSRSFHLIWSAGLFDYFNDRIFLKLLERYLPNLIPEGELVIGNFGVNNPTKGSMEALANWYLHHRSDQQLVRLANDAGARDNHKVLVGYEPTGVNRFLHVRNSKSTIRRDLPHVGLKGPAWLRGAGQFGGSERRWDLVKRKRSSSAAAVW